MCSKVVLYTYFNYRADNQVIEHLPKTPKCWRAKNLAILSENRDTKILANLNLAVWPWPWLDIYIYKPKTF